MAQIKIQDLFPLLKPGFVAMDKNGVWAWYKLKPDVFVCYSEWLPASEELGGATVLYGFDIAAFAGDWKDSLMECGK
jgi:hypothetical protein